MGLFHWHRRRFSLATQILIGMVLGLVVGFIVRSVPSGSAVHTYFVDGFCDVIGQWFIALLKMLVVPIVFVSLVCGTCRFSSAKTLGRVGAKVMSLFVVNTIIAVLIGVALASISHVGTTATLSLTSQFHAAAPLTVKQLLINLVPTNPIQAMAEGNLLQVIVFSILFGFAIGLSGSAGKPIADLAEALNKILIKLIELVIQTAPYGVFCLLVGAVAKLGIDLIGNLFFYCFIVFSALMVHTFGIYSLFLMFLSRLNPIIFFRKMFPAMMFAFSTASSSASIPILLETTEKQLGVDNLVSAFTVTLGTSIYKNGTAIMQGVAAVFIANLYHVPLCASSYLAIIVTTVLAAFSTAGVPGVGVFTLMIVLQQAGLPIDGIGILLGVDRILDMLRTSVSVTGVAMTACVVSKSEKTLDKKVYQSGELL